MKRINGTEKEQETWDCTVKGCKSCLLFTELFPKRQILDPWKLKEFADDNFRSDESGRNVFRTDRKKLLEKEKLLVSSNFSFSNSVF